MPTRTFYADNELDAMLTEILSELSKANGYRVSRGDLFAPYIRRKHGELFPPRKTKRAHKQITGDLTGMIGDNRA